MKSRALFSRTIWIVCLLGCQSELAALELPVPTPPSSNVVSFNDVSIEMTSCEITPDRSAICRLSITNRYTDKGIEIYRDIRIQDDLGSEYAVTTGGFGERVGWKTGTVWSQTAVADSSYSFTVIATNLSTRATSIRAVVFQRFLARDMNRRTLGYRDKVVFRSPRMVASGAPSTGRSTGPSNPTNPAVPPSGEGLALQSGWQDVGYWDYDGVDGQSLGVGIVYRPTPGGGLGRTWPGHLELRNHASLRARPRSLWPVRIHPDQRRICADYPGYPSYAVHVDLPGEAQDGVYQVARCRGDD
ncbi:MAG: hypothetical protein NXI30_09055 [bacterium]|nr:hypothetical protein [bacterium]